MTSLVRASSLLILAGTVLTACDGCEANNITTLRPPAIRVEPASLAFGPIPQGLAVDRPLTLHNDGEQDLKVDELVIRGATGAFRVLDGAPLQVRPRESAQVRVEFLPPVEEPITGELLIRSNAEENPEVSVPLSGEGTPRSVCGDCSSPPVDYCATPTYLILYEAMGTCVMGECRYDATRLQCPGGCDIERAECLAPTCPGPDCPDGGLPDASMPDATMPDASIPDASMPDAGNTPGLFTVPGIHTFVVPAGVTTLSADLWGGGGAGGNQVGATGGGGAFVRASLTVTPGETLDIWVAEGGSMQGDGAGASYVRRGDTVLLVAAGGGGGGSDGCSGCKSGGKGGAGGGQTGQSGEELLVGFNGFCTEATGGTGGTQTEGGQGGTTMGTAEHHCVGQPGAQHTGGRATGVNGNCDVTPGAQGWEAGGGQGNGGGGGGGAGWYGGGGAGFIWTYCAGGGGGGASYAAPSVGGATLQTGDWQIQGNPNESSGAGRGGDVLGSGAHGRVELTW